MGEVSISLQTIFIEDDLNINPNINPNINTDGTLFTKKNQETRFLIVSAKHPPSQTETLISSLLQVHVFRL